VNEDIKKFLEKYGGVKGGNLSLESLGWILSCLKDNNETRKSIIDYLNNHVEQTAQTAQFTTDYGQDRESNHLLLYSDRRTDAVCLDALIETQPLDPIIPKLVKGLVSHKKRGRWGSTQENIFALLALDRYFNTFEKVEPDFCARTWLDSTFAGEAIFKGRSTDLHTISVPMSHLVSSQTEKHLIVQKQGEGRLYYRIGLDYAPKDLNLAAVDQGFTVSRKYEAIDDPSHVTWDQDRREWRVKAGERVRVELRLITTQKRFHVALVDKLPAGFEPLNPSLLGTQSIPSKKDKEHTFCGYWSRWYEHENFRDERVECFSALLWEGAHFYSYVARATTPGLFITPPTKAEEMYSPEVFGRSSSERVNIFE